MAASDSSTVLPSALRRFQRRLRLAALTRHLTVASALALVAADAVVLASRPGTAIAAIFAGALALGVLAAVALAIVKAPSLHDTARIADRELLLQDRAVSALQFSRTPDPIARLVVADAAARLGAIPVSRLPLSIPVPARWLAASALVLSMAIVVTRGGPVPSATTTPESGAAATAPSGRSPNAQPQRAGGGATETRQQAGAAPAQPAPSRADTRQPGAAARGAAGDDKMRSKGMTGQEPADGSTPRADPPSRPSESRVADAGSATATEQGRRSGSATLNAAAGAASAPGAAAGGAAGRHGGGVRGGALVASGSRQAQASPPSVNRRTASYAEAYAHAEAAVPAERVPADLRSYVRAYFLAIRPGSTP